MDGNCLSQCLQFFVLSDETKPIVLFIPEASLIGIIVSEREGHYIHYDKIAIWFTKFCQTARAHDAYMQMKIFQAYTRNLNRYNWDCQNNLVLSLEQVIKNYGSEPILFGWHANCLQIIKKNWLNLKTVLSLYRGAVSQDTWRNWTVSWKWVKATELWLIQLISWVELSGVILKNQFPTLWSMKELIPYNKSMLFGELWFSFRPDLFHSFR